MRILRGGESVVLNRDKRPLYAWASCSFYLADFADFALTHYTTGLWISLLL